MWKQLPSMNFLSELQKQPQNKRLHLWQYVFVIYLVPWLSQSPPIYWTRQGWCRIYHPLWNCGWWRLGVAKWNTKDMLLHIDSCLQENFLMMEYWTMVRLFVMPISCVADDLLLSNQFWFPPLELLLVKTRCRWIKYTRKLMMSHIDWCL